MPLLGTLYSNTISEYFRGCPQYKGCKFFQDIKTIPENSFIFLNVSNQHWELLYNNSISEIIFFDSFGSAPEDSILRLMKATGKKIIVNHKDLEHYSGDNCGWYALLVCLELLKGKTLDDIMNQFTAKPSNQNRIILEKFFHFHTKNKVLDTSEIEKGGSLTNYILNREPIQCKLFLYNNGNQPVIDIKVCRISLNKAVEKISNWLSSGTIEENKKKLSYTDCYHLFLEINKKFEWEKNEVITLKTSNTIGKRHKDVLHINLYNNQSRTLKELFYNGEKINPESFYRYSAQRANCQVFCKNILQGSGLWTQEANNFIVQDAVKLLTEDVAKKMNIITDTAGLISKILPCLNWWFAIPAIIDSR